MDAPPAIPMRHRMRRKSLPPQDLHPNPVRASLATASPEVISSLITSLSIISTPANELFEDPGGKTTLPIANPSSPARSSFVPNNGRISGGSFGIDYGAYDVPASRNPAEGESLDELAASPPVIRTAKPPSGFSPLTAPSKSPSSRDSSPFKTFLGRGSRPSSHGSSGAADGDDSSSIGNLSIEPGLAPPNSELRKKRSGDSWNAKQSRNQKGVMYMNSKERLREKEQERKRANLTADRNITGLGLDRLSFPQLDQQPFLAESSISEETVPRRNESSSYKLTPKSGSAAASQDAVSPALSSNSHGIGSGYFIPARESSLRNSRSTSKKRSSRRSSHQGKMDGEDVDDTIHEMSEQEGRTQDSRKAQKGTSTTSTAKVNHVQADTEKIDDDGAPFPAVAQRKPRNPGKEADRPSIEKRKSGGTGSQSDLKSGSRLKRLSGPLSPRAMEADLNQKNLSNTQGRAASPLPSRRTQIHLDEQRSSLDPIDAAVEEYLSAPRLSQKIRHPQTGRVISFSEVGDPEGFVVFCCVGMGLTRYITAFYDELALTLKLRLITPDRPGVGASEPYADGTATPLSWPDDVYAICQALRVTKFSILAHSAGAIYALATALRMPQHIRGRIHLLAPWIPPSQMNVFNGQMASPPSNALPTSQRILRALPTGMLKVANSSFMNATSSSITSSLPKQRKSKRKSASNDLPSLALKSKAATGIDKENLARNSIARRDSSTLSHLQGAPDDLSDSKDAAQAAAEASEQADKERQMTYDAYLTQGIWDLATSGANPAVDLLVCLERKHTIGFRYVDITRSVVIHHGSKDSRVPVDNVRWLGKTMKRCEVRVLEGEGHGLMASAVVMGGVLMEIAREWDDWARVTNSVKPDVQKKSLRERASVGAFR